VWIKSGICSADSLINILLCMLGYLPGLLHAWYIISTHPERDYDYEPIDSESGPQNGRVTYYFVRHEQGRSQGQGQGQAQPKPQAPRNYGTQGPRVPNETNPAAGPSTGAGSDEPGAPPSYSEVVKGDNKVQSAE
jgi:hypothetical protein